MSCSANAAFCLGLFVLAGQSVAATTVYRSVTPDGAVRFSDRPGAATTAVEVQAPSTYQPPAPRPAPAKAAITPAAYRVLKVTAPEADSVYWRAQGAIPVGFRVDPPLQEGHRVVVLVDGSPAPSDTLAVSTQDLLPGRHEVAVEVRDAQDQPLLTSEPVGFFLRQHTLNLPARRRPAGGGNG